MSFEVRRANADDVVGMRSVLFSAFGETLIGRQMFPATSEAAQTFWLEGLHKEIQDPYAIFLVATPAGSPDTIIGCAKWQDPTAHFEDPPPTEVYPKDGNPDLATRFFGGLSRAHRKFMTGKRHWYLELLGVRKESMGKGVARPLVQWGLDRADADGLPCFLEATQNAKKLYERAGFRTLEEEVFESPQGDIWQYYMMRDPKSATDSRKGEAEGSISEDGDMS